VFGIEHFQKSLDVGISVFPFCRKGIVKDNRCTIGKLLSSSGCRSFNTRGVFPSPSPSPCNQFSGVWRTPAGTSVVERPIIPLRLSQTGDYTQQLGPSSGWNGLRDKLRSCSETEHPPSSFGRVRVIPPRPGHAGRYARSKRPARFCLAKGSQRTVDPKGLWIPTLL
jgi:hypothetical protein